MERKIEVPDNRLNWHYLKVHAFEACIAFASVLSAFLFFTALDVTNTPLGEVLKPWQYFWNSLYGGSGILILVGLAYPGKKFLYWYGQALELGGLIMLITAVFVNMVATIYVLGLTPGQSIFVAIIAAAFMRIRTIYDLAKVYHMSLRVRS